MEQPVGKSVVLRYGHIEAALAEIMNIEPENAKAFHARLRHLRNIGVPAGLPTPGKGQAIKYTRKHALELLIAVSLQNAGIGPRAAAKAANNMNEVFQSGSERTEENIFGAVYPSIGKQEDAYIHCTVLPGAERLTESLKLMEKLPVAPVVTIINLSRLNALLQNSLNRQIYI
ncbi:MAG: hypothetical protein WBX25_21060 [Rhodomicrobium sp.]